MSDNKSSRREFVKNAALSGALSTLPLAGIVGAHSNKQLNILILGGTGFLGPHTVNAALARGHKVTLFNRGTTNPDLFSQLETIIGDRNTKDIQQLANRKWDAVIDTSAYIPRSVELAMQVLKNNINQYLFVSSISVYADWSTPNMDESASVGLLKDDSIEEVDGETYGPLKALCEQMAEKQMPGRVSNIRPGLIVGPLDKTDRFTYWPMRIKRGGDVLAPGDGNDFIQFIDVRDLAEWMIHCLENKITGVYNAQSNGADITIKQLLKRCVELLNPAAKLVWVSADFLEKHKVAPWGDMPVWIPAKDDFAGSGQMSSKRAYANGLKQRNVDTIILDCYQWFASLPTERQTELRAGISQEREKKVLMAWQQHNAVNK